VLRVVGKEGGEGQRVVGKVGNAKGGGKKGKG
jgi:hypothetical protein